MTKQSCQTPPFLTVREFATLTSVCTKSVRRWIVRGDLRIHRFGRQIRIANEDALSFIAARRR
jgi:excisionase family DNA binding protein